jgi:hypothetical protein
MANSGISDFHASWDNGVTKYDYLVITFVQSESTNLKLHPPYTLLSHHIPTPSPTSWKLEKSIGLHGEQ